MYTAIIVVQNGGEVRERVICNITARKTRDKKKRKKKEEKKNKGKSKENQRKIK